MQRIIITAALLFTACGNTTEESSTPVCDEVSVNVDSLLDIMAMRYDTLCYERKAALAERDSTTREELLRVNDAACRDFEDSLQVLLSLRECTVE
jgi:hypothetical protein